MAPIATNSEQRTEDSYGQNNTTVFNASKKELFIPASGFRNLVRKLTNYWKVIINKEEITLERLLYANLFVLAGPREKISASEFEAMKPYLEKGGSILVLLGEGGEIPNDFSKMFEKDLFKLDTAIVPEVLRSCHEMRGSTVDSSAV
ncbi:intraflagellar transport protein 52 homolog isoform X3 [Xenia sp. Carnegie-2017]|uniref:intraflagellar transport protein 52 homolog isoform X3 n=1 Tax=Xenia sp. Carnegie-2017 TaxID=2897299 RepID=UPI001F042263|nr:intraflagellar transport protein 52 homolog isoform X3 [Xenia sp. Carnegie-2017]